MAKLRVIVTTNRGEQFMEEFRERTEEEVAKAKTGINSFMASLPGVDRMIFAIDDNEKGYFCIGREEVRYIELEFSQAGAETTHET